MFDLTGLVAPEATPIAVSLGRPQERDQRRQRRLRACEDRRRRLARKRRAKARETTAQWEAFYASLSERQRAEAEDRCLCVRCGGAETQEPSCGLCEACTY